MTRASRAGQDDASLLWLVGVMLRERRTILWFAAIGIALSAAVGLLRERNWSSSFSFVPQDGPSPTAGLASLAGQFGVDIGSIAGGEQPPELYADILLTREVLEPIAQDRFTGKEGEPVALARLLKVRGRDTAVVLERTLKKLRSDVVSAGVANRTTGMVVVRVRTKSAQASHEIARRLLDELERFNTVTRQTQGRAEREFTERRLGEARDSLRVSERVLQGFLERNRILTNSPALTFERDRLQREVTLHQQVYTALAQQFEEARLKEVRDTPVITMIESPRLPARPDSRMLAIMLAVGTLAALFAGMLVVLGREAWRRERIRGDDPALTVISGEMAAIRSRFGKSRD